MTDRNFRPCKCGYQICLFCYNKIKDNHNGACPACRCRLIPASVPPARAGVHVHSLRLPPNRGRTPYDEANAVFVTPDPSEYARTRRREPLHLRGPCVRRFLPSRRPDAPAPGRCAQGGEDGQGEEGQGAQGQKGAAGPPARPRRLRRCAGQRALHETRTPLPLSSPLPSPLLDPTPHITPHHSRITHTSPRLHLQAKELKEKREAEKQAIAQAQALRTAAAQAQAQTQRAAAAQAAASSSAAAGRGGAVTGKAVTEAERMRMVQRTLVYVMGLSPRLAKEVPHRRRQTNPRAHSALRQQRWSGGAPTHRRLASSRPCLRLTHPFCTHTACDRRSCFAGTSTLGSTARSSRLR